MNDTEQVKKDLERFDTHQKWISVYRNPEVAPFYELAFDYITSMLRSPRGSRFLDAGCGTCSHSIRLAKRGFRVQAVDFSEAVLEQARAEVKSRELNNIIQIQKEDILHLSFQDQTFDNILCWGVLMHVPEVEQAIIELIRVLKPGGRLIIGEGNMYSLEDVFTSFIKRALRRERASVRKTSTGVEYWRQTPDGMFLSRHANIQWVIKYVTSHGLVLKKRTAGQFTELYTRLSHKSLRSIVHQLNNCWFRYIRFPQPAYSNIMFFEKPFS
jgi:ubiquinone/menaquinone biosynthesis C-methylase UbiE